MGRSSRKYLQCRKSFKEIIIEDHIKKDWATFFAQSFFVLENNVVSIDVVSGTAKIQLSTHGGQLD